MKFLVIDFEEGDYKHFDTEIGLKTYLEDEYKDEPTRLAFDQEDRRLIILSLEPLKAIEVRAKVIVSLKD